jgi:hypothetical protein
MITGSIKTFSAKRLTFIVAVFLCMAFMIPAVASAAYYNEYTTVATLNNANGCSTTQTFGVGSTYVYSVKICSGDTKAIIWRTKKSDGTSTLMTNGDTNTTYNTYLGHANDMALFTNNDEYYMFVVTMKEGSLSLVKLKYVGTTYYKVGNYIINYEGSAKSMSGVAITGKDSNNINFLFKSGSTLYKGSLPLTANSGTINVTNSFSLNTADAKVNGSAISNISSYVFQGLGYYDDTIYVPMTYQNVSIVLVYRNVSTASGTITSDNSLSFRITSSAYPDLFEIEGVGIANGGALWYSNRRTEPGDTAHDGVHYFNGYSAP